jgi:hypothetical protein
MAIWRIICDVDKKLTHNRTIGFSHPFQIARINNQIIYKPTIKYRINQTDMEISVMDH